MKVKFKKLHPDAVIPRYAKSGDAGLDFVAVTKTYVRVPYSQYLKYIEYDTGLALEIPEGFEGVARPRSSISDTCLILTNSPGTIDSGYRGSIKARFKILGFGKEYEVGDRIFQLIVQPVTKIELEEVDGLSESDRGTGAYGSSGT